MSLPATPLRRPVPSFPSLASGTRYFSSAERPHETIWSANVHDLHVDADGLRISAAGSCAAGAAVLSTQTSLGTTANNNQTTPGQQVLLTAVVFTGANLVNAGTVAFADNGNTVSGCGSAEINPTNGIAFCDATFSTAGVHPLTATFSGTPEFIASTSETYALSVIATPTVTVQPAYSTITTAYLDHVTVTVNGGGGNPTATGTVTLSSGSYTSAATTLSSGSATFITSTLKAGTHAVTADYPGDANFAASKSKPVKQVVN